MKELTNEELMALMLGRRLTLGDYSNYCDAVSTSECPVDLLDVDWELNMETAVLEASQGIHILEAREDPDGDGWSIHWCYASDTDRKWQPCGWKATLLDLIT